jgi:hypothetical protein
VQGSVANGTAPITRFYSFTQDKSELEGDLGDDDAYVIATVTGGHLSSEYSPEGEFGRSFSRADLMWNNRLGEERGSGGQRLRGGVREGRVSSCHILDGRRSISGRLSRSIR